MADTAEATGSLSVDQAVASLLTGDTVADTQKDSEPQAHAEEADATPATDEVADAQPDDSAEAEEVAEPTEPVKVRFKLPDGTEVEATPDELSKSYLRQSDYTKKTTELAQQRKAIEQEAASLRANRAQELQVLQTAQHLLAQSLPPEPDLSLLNSDPIEFTRQKAVHDLALQRLNEMSVQQQRIAQQMQYEQAKALQDKLSNESQTLAERIPEWKDETTAKAEKAKLIEYGKRWGYSDAELSQVYDSRDVVVMRKAMLFDEMMAKKPGIEAKAAAAPKLMPAAAVQNRGNSRDTEVARAHAKLAKSGRIEDAVAALLM